MLKFLRLRIGLRHAAFRVFSASRSTPSLSCRSRSISTAISLTSRSRPLRPIVCHLQRRYASEAAQTQSEPVADRETEAQHGDNSIAAASQEQSQPSEAELAETEPVQQSPPKQSQQEHSTLGELASSAADKAKETASSAYNAITGESSGAGEFGQRRPEYRPSASVYIGNLYFDVNEEDVRKYFEKCGPIESVKIILDNRGLSKGYVQFF
ncbi:MAG: hypothetical protein Q9179_007108 [Wetmoreana sp. 5 TL-2023]